MVTPETALEALCVAFTKRLQQLSNGFASIRADWLARAEGLGKTVRVKLGDEHVEGIFEDMDEDGRADPSIAGRRKADHKNR